MNRQVTHDGTGALEIRFPYDRNLVEQVKALPRRRWNATDRFWSVPETEVVALVDLLASHGFEFDRATRDLYASMGGTRALPDLSPAVAGPRLPGLFDPPSADDPLPAPNRVQSPLDSLFDPEPDSPDYTVSVLNARVLDAIQSAFGSAVWLVGEISGFSKNAHRRHVSFDLVERADDGRVVSKIPAVLFAATRKSIDDALRHAGDPFQLEDEVTVRLRVKVDLYVPWGQYRIVVEDLDVRYTLGEAARRREEIVRRLTEAGLLERNSALPLPDLPLRLGLITSLGSDAYNDVLRTLHESGYAFEVTVHGARVQGHSTEPSVLNALDWFRERTGQFDLVLICRGGGARTDLVWFDSEPLGTTVALFPLPVIVGIGHEQDLSVLDAVGRSCKTPTAAAAFVVQRVEDSLRRLEETTREILALASTVIRGEKREGAAHARRLATAARNLLQHERTTLGNRKQRALVGARAALAGAQDRLARWEALIPRDARALLERQLGFLDTALRGIRRSAGHDLRRAREKTDRLAKTLAPRSMQCLARDAERMDQRAHRLQLVHPRRVLDRGYAILRDETGRVITEVGGAPAGSRVVADLKDGRLGLRSEGREHGPEGD
jgi:exodeoxyribonuclease VII large subunit